MLPLFPGIMSPEDSEQRFAFKPRTPPAQACCWREGGMGGHTKTPYELSSPCLSCRLRRANGFCTKQPFRPRLELVCGIRAYSRVSRAVWMAHLLLKMKASTPPLCGLGTGLREQRDHACIRTCMYMLTHAHVHTHTYVFSLMQYLSMFM